ncbi:MAG TPA: chemotaxis protein CheW [Candidatus Paceibacterota bacterium]|nr:chemotaxis protein CheW [Candidatus Paceibacterota bacterium]
MPEASSPGTTATQNLAGRYLTFMLEHESYGVDVLKVREIIRLAQITAVPRMPAYVKGVINLRGKIIPVMDLRLRFGFTNIHDTEQTCIVVVQTRLSAERTIQMGLVVDAVEEVVSISAADIEETPDFGSQISADYILGLAKIKGAVKGLLDINRVMGSETMEAVTTNI